jgi:hypothetical protein
VHKQWLCGEIMSGQRTDHKSIRGYKCLKLEKCNNINLWDLSSSPMCVLLLVKRQQLNVFDVDVYCTMQNVHGIPLEPLQLHACGKSPV